MASIKIMKNTVVNAETAISLPNNADAIIDNNGLYGCVTGIEVRDAQSLKGLMQQIGLPEDTPPDLLLEALRILLQKTDASPAERQKALESSSLFSWAEAANKVTVLQAILDLRYADIQSVINGILGCLN